MLSKVEAAAQKCQDLAVRAQEAIHAGDWDAADPLFADLMDLTTPRLMRKAEQKVSLEQAEDLVAETLLELYEALKGTTAIASVNDWLWIVLRNKIAGYYRLRKNTAASTKPAEFWSQREEDAAAPGETPMPDPFKATADGISHRRLNQLLDDLGAGAPELRDVIEAQYFHDESVLATANRLGLTQDKVKKRRAEALRQLHRIARNRGFDNDL